jgi:predicted DNA-binding transcriptional regulator YafY
VDRVERLTNLLALLLETRVPLTLVEIAGELSGMYPEAATARRAAFERDKAGLRSIGVPIETEMVLAGADAGTSRYWIDRSRYELADVDFTPEEQRALQVAVATTRGGSGSAQDGLWKLGVGVAEASPVLIARMPSSPALASLREAVSTRATAHFLYRDRERVVEPYGLVLQDGFWYLIGRDRGPAEPRTFRVDRIRSEVTLGDQGSFERPDVDLRTILPRDPKEMRIGDAAVDALVRVTGARSVFVERDLGVERVVASGGGSLADPMRWIEVSVPCENREAFRSWVIGLGSDAEVLSPPEVRADLIAWLTTVAVGQSSGAQ